MSKCIIVLFISLGLGSCSVQHINGRSYMLPDPSVLGSNPNKNLSREVLGGNPLNPQTIKGYGFVSKAGITLYKNHAVNDAIGKCQVGILFNQSFHPRCSGRNTLRYQMIVLPIKAGDTFQTAHKNGLAGQLISHGVEIADFSMTGDDPNSCYIIMTHEGTPVPVRKGQGLSAYTFSNPLIAQATKSKDQNDDLARAQKKLKSFENQALSSKNFLKNSSAYRGGKCITAKHRPIPAKPRVMSKEKSKFQAGGTCVDLYASRHSMKDVYNALGAIQRRDLVKTHRKWLKGDSPSCTKLNISQVNSFMCDFVKFLGVHAYRGCIQNKISECMITVNNQCRGGLFEWQRQANAIRREPVDKRQICERSITTLQVTKTAIPKIKRKIAQLTSEIKHTPKSNTPSKIDLDQATCSL